MLRHRCWRCGHTLMRYAGRSMFSTLSSSQLAAVQAFRHRALPDVTAALEGPGTGSVRLGETLRSIACEEVADLSEDVSKEAAAQCEQEASEVLQALADLEEHRKERRRLQANRADILAMGFQNINEENQEFASLIVCATAGIFAVSIHYAFFVLWFAGYLIYRRSTRSVRRQHTALENLEDITDRLKELDALESKRLEDLQARLQAWKPSAE
ncbi:unnamed protein product [Durusdinium trenchii]|uniref:Calcium uniporter protein n=1 Tax=Durusdinium trenchii TaxID=1381693 RepID=A0ABP0P6A1_9DINO